MGQLKNTRLRIEISISGTQCTGNDAFSKVLGFQTKGERLREVELSGLCFLKERDLGQFDENITAIRQYKPCTT